MKKALMASTALVGCVSLLASTAGAQEAAPTPTVGGNLELEIEGEVRFTVDGADNDISNEGQGRGYRFAADDSEITFSARGTSDLGFDYGLVIELQAQTDDVENADQVWIFLTNEQLGRVELGDQDSAADRMFVDGGDVLQGRGGYDGETDQINFGSALAENEFAATESASKAIYFTPRIAGFQAGISWTPDTDHLGGQALVDNDGSYEKVISPGFNYQNTFGDVEVTAAIAGEFGDSEPDPAEDEDVGEDLKIWGVGGIVSYAGFSVGAGYADLGDDQFDEDADRGKWWNLGASYVQGPWGASIGYLHTELDPGAGLDDAEVDFYTVNGTYNVAPGLELAVDLNIFENDNCCGPSETEDNDGWSYTISLTTSF